ncbi:nitrite reductase small subunit NirD [Notoacmeibacter marinus]|uniref:nitrite reductase small subunit NirD n=1 Tax=Notoacmeibacter marinus TaxID=1876515 RepID=UPI000DF1A754|nr:nitrite reductase small subunit NirD [Notoacmeibacter marinus]
MNAIETKWIAVGSIADIPREGARCVEAGALRIAIFRTVDDDVYAIEDRCPHKGGPLSQGIVHGGCVTCPLHNMVIALESGEAQGADEGRVTVFRTRQRDGLIFVSGADIASATARQPVSTAA